MKKDNLEGKKILLLMPSFFNYTELLINELKNRGAHVDFIENKQLAFDFVSPKCKFRSLRKLVFTIFDLKWHYLKKRIDLTKKYDYFFCINGFLFDKRIIEKLKGKNPNIKTILYLWDSMEMFEWKNISKHFDTSFTFDPIDAKKMQIEYLANFYPKNIDLYNDSVKNNIFFVGTQHSDRYDVIKKIDNCNYVSMINVKLLIKYKNIIHTKLVYVFLRTLNTPFSISYTKNYELVERIRKDSFLIYNSLNSETILNLMKESRFVLDIQAPSQVGIPHQMMIALAMGKQIITTNEWIKNYNFYNPKQILIIDRNNPILLKTFLESDFQADINDEVKNSRIDNWVNIIFK